MHQYRARTGFGSTISGGSGTPLCRRRSVGIHPHFLHGCFKGFSGIPGAHDQSLAFLADADTRLIADHLAQASVVSVDLEVNTKLTRAPLKTP